MNMRAIFRSLVRIAAVAVGASEFDRRRGMHRLNTDMARKAGATLCLRRFKLRADRHHGGCRGEATYDHSVSHQNVRTTSVNM